MEFSILSTWRSFSLLLVKLFIVFSLLGQSLLLVKDFEMLIVNGLIV